MYSTTVYFGNIAYWKEQAQVGKICLDYKDVYKKQSFRNRQEILSANGKQALSIPVIRPNGSNTLSKDVRISDAENWQKDHWKAIESAYKHAPYFWYYGDQVKDLIFQEEKSLVEFNKNIQQAIIEFLSLELEITLENDAPNIENMEDPRVFLNDKKNKINTPPYIQVFSDKLTFEPNLSVLDALMNLGPMSRMLIIS
ncbi:WbqC-like protein family protein [Lishizhenia tianjinensis]|uniref:WbqC-like protein family protein n=1 Tax=Lishizhenia tianjinensis TaxID=477690 RepID=A0A1I6YXS5_9FLAO|nr:WbqC family protein [Lishizhenia tianjinensis]SFT55247.1 WbqC-like protein family protein [Lishizhenia tianjinensis]